MTLKPSASGLETHKEKVLRSISLASEYAFEHSEDDGHWYGEMRTNSTMTAEYVMLQCILGIDLLPNAEAFKHELLSAQKKDGGWNIGYGLPGDISTSVEAYLALRLLGVPSDNAAMQSGRQFITGIGGIPKVRIFTRIYLAMFGLFPWSGIPQLPPELILLPPQTKINVYRMSSWARSTLVPLLVIAHHQPTFPLPNGLSTDNDFIDELWRNPGNKSVPYSPPLLEQWRRKGLFSWESGFTIADTALYYLSNALRKSPTRKYAIKKCVDWVLERQEKSGDWAGILPPMINGIIMLHLEGFSHDSKPFQGGLAAMERFIRKNDKGMHAQACVSPVWDTALMTIGLLDAGIPGSDKRIQKALDWTKERQIHGPEGDWRIYRPELTAGGWAFEYHNTWYPDIDDTAAVIIAFVKQEPESAGSDHVLLALDWLLGMVNPDGGWGAFDVENNNLFMNKCPFSDLDALCDPSTADVTGRVMEAFGLVLSSRACPIDIGLEKRLTMAVHNAINYLASIQVSSGSWWGRWGVNYVYGTSNVLCALAYSDGGRVEELVNPAIGWLKSCQAPNGGWGECLETYADPEKAGKGDTTASQTAWALMGLLAHLPPTDVSIQRGMAFLLDSQDDHQNGKGASWLEPQYTGTGFPNHFYLRYDFYRHYFPLMALGRYSKAMKFDGSVK
ncbi:Squalene--hopene cyclase [Lachnellula occidentalis]|uniref:Terpene cyclase/mutase family member n=1 Tax=Lachnellula occidentalis TaxID=215460 RepID=A0A8H8UKP0_9HELO|nr:Squalene--hopene cyclase [Lachnellula occidentalis]